MIKRLEAKGAFFRSLTDPIDTASPQEQFTLQVQSAAAGFERALIRDGTSTPTNYASLLVVFLVATVYLHGAVRIGSNGLTDTSLARPAGSLTVRATTDVIQTA